MKSNFIAVVVCVFALVALSGCSLLGILGIDTCGLGTMRCHANTVQLCKTGLGWTDAAACDDIAAAEGGTWTCGSPKGVCSEYHTCMPVPEKTEQEKGDKKEKPDKTEKKDAPASKSEKTEKKESPRGSR